MDNTKVATKSDIKLLRTELKIDVKNVKNDIKNVKTDVKGLRGEVLKVEARVENVEDGIEEIKVMLGKMANTLDGFVGRVDNLTVDNEVGTHHTRELQVKAENHEERLKKIESSQAA